MPFLIFLFNVIVFLLGLEFYDFDQSMQQRAIEIRTPQEYKTASIFKGLKTLKNIKGDKSQEEQIQWVLRQNDIETTSLNSGEYFEIQVKNIDDKSWALRVLTLEMLYGRLAVGVDNCFISTGYAYPYIRNPK